MNTKSIFINLGNQTYKNKNTPHGVFFLVEAWVGIEPASKDLQSSA